MRRKNRSESGQSALEFAIILPVLLAIVVGIFEFGIAWNRKQVLTNAAREGARWLVLPGTDPALARSEIDIYLTSAGIDPATVADSIDQETGSTGDTVTVQLTLVHELAFIGPILDLLGGSSVPGSVDLVSTVNMRHE